MTERLAALLFATAPAAALAAGGLSVIGRQVRQAERAGATRIVIVAPAPAPELADALAALQADTLQVVATPDALGQALAAAERVLVIAEALVVDERIIDATFAAHGLSAVAVWPPAAAPAGAERIDDAALSAGVAVHDGERLRAWVREREFSVLQAQVLQRAASDPAATRVDIAALNLYVPRLRRNAPFVWIKVGDGADAQRATDALIASAQKGCLDWPARFIHPPIEDALVRALLPTPISPNMVTLLVTVLGLVAAVAFGAGWLWTGLVLALVIGPLDGVDGKLARTRLEFSRWGDLEHVLDKVVEYLWYACLAYHFAQSRDAAGPWAIAALITLFALAEAVQNEFYRRFTGQALDDAAPFDRRYRLVSGRRNTFFWTYVPFALAGAWYAGFVMIAVYSVVNFFVAQWRFFVNLQSYGCAVSRTIEANFQRTAYAFLPQDDAGDGTPAPGKG